MAADILQVSSISWELSTKVSKKSGVGSSKNPQKRKLTCTIFLSSYFNLLNQRCNFLLFSAKASREELMLMCTTDIVQQLIAAYEEERLGRGTGKELNLNSIKCLTSSKYV